MEHVVWWQVYPLGFVGAEPSSITASEHRFGHIVTWLDHLIELGCNGLSLGPVFASSTHGYDTVDHFRVDSRLGDEDDLARLIREAHARGISVMLDGVFNHVGRDHPRFRGALAAGPDSEDGRWFLWDGDQPLNFEGHDILVTLDHTNPAVQDHVVHVLTYWIDRGVDAWRFDAAYAIPPEFFATILPRVRERAPESWFIGEMIHGDYSRFVSASTVDSVTQYQLWKSIWSSLNDGNFYELAHAVSTNNSMLDTFVPGTFVGNHDVTRIASTLDDSRHIAIATALLLFLAGVPSIYYGDEHAYRGIKEDRMGGDDAVRPRFPTSPSQLAPDGLPTYHLHQELIGLRRRYSWLYRSHSEVSALSNTTIALTSSGQGQELTLLIDLNRIDLPPVPYGHSREGGTVLASGAGWSITQTA